MPNVSIRNHPYGHMDSQLEDAHSRQPWFVLNAAKHYDLVMSDEYAISHFYSFEADLSNGLVFAIPDGCIDIVFDCDQTHPSAKICGTTLEAQSANLIHKHRYFGVRFSVGVLPEFLDVSASELVNNELNFLDLAPEARSVFEQVVNQPVLMHQVNLFRDFYVGKKPRKPSALTLEAVRVISEKKGNIQVKTLENLTGYSIRTLQRQFRNDMGISPKAFSRIIRGQSAVHDIGHRDKLVFSDLANDLGFSDQSHFQREFKKFVSITPIDYQRRIKQDAYLRRIRYSCQTLNTHSAAGPGSQGPNHKHWQ